MTVRFKIRAHTSTSGPDRWAWIEDFVQTFLGPCIAWTLDEAQAATSHGFDNEQGHHIANPTPEQMAIINALDPKGFRVKALG